MNKPLASFMFLGPSGTGKTYTAKVLNEILYGNKKNSLIKIDMSEYTEKFNISKLIGAPAGYVGYKESGQLTDAVVRNPNSIILFDEIEKAHPDIFNLLLQILDDGSLTDASGKKINFKNTIIVMTSNIGTDKLNKTLGFENNFTTQDEATVKGEVKKFFRPEFINRLDKILVFNHLQSASLLKIIRIELEQLQQRLKKQNINLVIDNKIIPFLLKTNFQDNLGARFIKQNIEELVANQIAEKLLSNENNKSLALNLNNNQIVISHA
jgi:ATP-dependent Clp protease ATP-binding subunit ClpA